MSFLKNIENETFTIRNWHFDVPIVNVRQKGTDLNRSPELHSLTFLQKKSFKF